MMFLKINWSTVVESIITNGGIIGLLGLILSLREYQNKKPKIICKIDDVFDTFWEHGDEINLDQFNSDFANSIKNQDVVVLTLNVINIKNVPLTLQGFYYQDDEGNKYPVYTQIDFKDPIFKTAFVDADTNEEVYLPLITQGNDIKFPYKLGGYDAIKIRLIILEERKNEECRHYNLTLKTPFKDFEYIFEVHSDKYRAIHKPVGLIEAAQIERKLYKK